MSELLVTCLFCGRINFSTRGLRAHRCPSKPGPKGNKKHSAPLTKGEWQACVDVARGGGR